MLSECNSHGLASFRLIFSVHVKLDPEGVQLLDTGGDPAESVEQGDDLVAGEPELLHWRHQDLQRSPDTCHLNMPLSASIYYFIHIVLLLLFR